MTGLTIGYVRVSTFEQNMDRQLEEIKIFTVFTDKHRGKMPGDPHCLQLTFHARFATKNHAKFVIASEMVINLFFSSMENMPTG
jgi:TnpA family transposase